MKHIFFFALTACSGENFVSIPEGGLPDGDSSPESSTGNDSGSDPGDSGGLDAREAGDDSSTVDAKPDGPCPTGTNACNDAITAFCSRMAACCNGTCLYAWQNMGGSQCAAQFNTGSCSGKTVCENICLNDIQIASCVTIKGAPSPAYVGNCMGLWQ